MPQRLKLIVAYDGGRFAGWQSQRHGKTVQDELERAFKRITGHQIRVHGAGRTDSGVHALGQCAHADVDDQRLSCAQWLAALNASLPPSLRVLRCQSVSAEFHARFSAAGKVYRYRIWTGRILPPLEYGRVWHFPRTLDLAVMQAAAARFVGKHDFAGFAANRGRAENNTVRNLRSVIVRKRGFLWILEVDGDGFLYKMVRLIVGALIDCATGKITLEELTRRIDGRAQSSNRIAVPAAGLYLIRVRY
ncbi:MAG: tRNA pseudouridine(38-40) synthase TruA [Chthoniobacterales bacterium]